MVEQAVGDESEAPPSGVTAGSRRSQDVTRRLLDAAVEVFGERGYEAARIHEVARRCELTTGAVYSRWPTKLDLFLAVVEYVTPQRMMFVVGSTDMSTEDKFATLGANLLSPSGHKFRDVMLEAFVTARRDETLASTVSASLVTEANHLSHLIDEGKESGYVDASLSTEAMVLLCQALGLGTHLVVSVGADGRQAPAPDDWNDLILRVIAAVAPPHSGDPP